MYKRTKAVVVRILRSGGVQTGDIDGRI